MTNKSDNANREKFEDELDLIILNYRKNLSDNDIKISVNRVLTHITDNTLKPYSPVPINAILALGVASLVLIVLLIASRFWS